MTWQSLTSSSLPSSVPSRVPLANARGSEALSLSRDRKGAVVSGRVFAILLYLTNAAFGATITGTVELTDSRDPAVAKKKDYSGVVVWLEGEALPRASTAGARKYTLAQRGKKFRPHVLAIPVGSVVDFPNFDPIFHNAFSNFAGQPFDVGLYAPGTTREVRFRRPGIVRVFCNIHSNMTAVIAVLDTPYFAQTDARGGWRIDNVPAGEYRLRFFHERASEATLRALDTSITVRDGGFEVPLVRISESGYLEVPHKNKHGQDYPPVPREHILYPGARE
jgi:plastocyanin